LADIDVAAFIEELSTEKGMKLLNLMNTGKATKCFLMLPTDKKNDLLEQSDEVLVEALLRLVDLPTRTRLLSMLSPDKAAIVKRRLEQTPNSVGVFMLPAITASKNKTAKEAIQILKSNKEFLDASIYLVNLEGELEGMVGLKELMLAEKSQTLDEIMITNVPRFVSDTPIKNILDHPAWLEYSAIPVIDKSQRLLGSLPYLKTKEMVYKAARPQTKQVIKTGSELGELYLIGLSGLLHAVGK
jgi:magnesium transporter